MNKNSIQRVPKKTHRIFITGDFGVGKSTIINICVGQTVCPTGDTFEAVTKQPKQITLHSDHRNKLTINDTPGFQPDDFENIRCLDRILLSEFPCNVVLFVQNITNPRITPTLLEELKVYKYDYGLPIILVLNKASPKDRAKLEKAWRRNLTELKYDKIVDEIVVLETVDIENGEVPNDIHELVEKTSRFINRQSAPSVDLSTRAGRMAERLRRMQALKSSKYALIAVSVAAAAALTVGLSPVPFSDAVLLVPIELSMFAGICAAFHLQLTKGLFIWLLSSGVGAFGIGFGVIKVINGLLKLIPGANVAAMAIDGSMAFACTLTLGFALIAVLRSLVIQGVDLASMNDKEKKKLLEEYFKEEVKKKWSLFFRNSKCQKEAFQEEIQCLEGMETNANLTNADSLDIDKLLQSKEKIVRQEKLQNSERLCKIQELERENKTLADVCCICLRTKSNIITQPCGHCCMCASDYTDYAKHILVCPRSDCAKKIVSFEFLKT